MKRRLAIGSAIGLCLAVEAGVAHAQWSRVVELPPFDVFSVYAKGDTILAGADTAVYVSTNGGATWEASARVGPTVISVDALWIGSGQIYAGTLGQGVFASTNLGDTWTPRSVGLAGGPLGSMSIIDFESRGDTLIAATGGAGAYVLRLSAPATWQPFGTALVVNQAGGVADLAREGQRVLATGGANGLAFWNDRGMADWTVTFLNNTGLSPNVSTSGIAWTGSRWMVSTPFGCHRSATGQGAWQNVGPSTGFVTEGCLAVRNGVLFAALNHGNAEFYVTANAGDSWTSLGTTTYVYELAISGSTLYAARLDGLWKREIGTVSVPNERRGLGFSIVASGVGGATHFRFALPDAGVVELEVFDAQGRRSRDSSTARCRRERTRSNGIPREPRRESTSRDCGRPVSRRRYERRD